jgi:hypothetical protein
MNLHGKAGAVPQAGDSAEFYQYREDRARVAIL